jgi:hypothetical protein
LPCGEFARGIYQRQSAFIGGQDISDTSPRPSPHSSDERGEGKEHATGGINGKDGESIVKPMTYDDSFQQLKARNLSFVL